MLNESWDMMSSPPPEACSIAAYGKANAGCCNLSIVTGYSKGSHTGDIDLVDYGRGSRSLESPRLALEPLLLIRFIRRKHKEEFRSSC